MKRRTFLTAVLRRGAERMEAGFLGTHEYDEGTGQTVDTTAARRS